VTQASRGAMAAVCTIGTALSLVAFVALRDKGARPVPPPAPVPAQLAASDAKPTEPAAAKQVIDGRTGLFLAEGWEIVAARCTSCHSARLVTRSAGDRMFWARVLHWTQETQELATLPAAEEDTLLDYLATNYGPRAYARRAPLDPWLLPAAPPGFARPAARVRPPLR